MLRARQLLVREPKLASVLLCGDKIELPRPPARAKISTAKNIVISGQALSSGNASSSNVSRQMSSTNSSKIGLASHRRFAHQRDASKVFSRAIYSASWMRPPQPGRTYSFTKAPYPQIRKNHSSSVRDTVRIRKALPSDYETVYNLANIDGGQDYLFALYNTFVTDEDNYAIVATLDDQVVGFYMATALDGGRTVIRRAARVAEQYRGRGIYLAMEAELERYIRDDCPDAQFVAVCKCDKDEHLIGRYEGQGFRQDYIRDGTQMIVRPTSGQAGGDHDGDSSLKIEPREMTAEDLKLLFRAENVSKELFPAGKLLNFYLCYRPLEENVRHLICDRGGAFVSFTEHPARRCLEPRPQPHAQAASAFAEGRAVHDVAMATFYYYYPTLAKPCYFLDAYARPGVSRDHFRAHLHQNLKLLKRNFPDQDAILALTYESTMSRDHVMTSLQEADVVDEKSDPDLYQLLYEREQERTQSFIKTKLQ